MPDLPTGTITFLFTDIEGSTRLWEEQPDAMQLTLARHDALLRAAIETNSGHVFKTMGDAFCAAFASPSSALDAALAIQQQLSEASPAGSHLPVRVRMALHTGTAEHRDGDYFGPALNRVARLMNTGHGGQILLSEATQLLVQESLPTGASLLDLGYHQLKDLNRAEQVYQVVHPDLRSRFPTLKSVGSFPNNLPEQLTSFVGREQEIQRLKEWLRTYRLVTLTGPGGTGKTRLALQVTAEMLEEFNGGVYLVDLSAVTQPNLIPPSIAYVLGVREEPSRPLLETLKSHLRDRQMLLLIDNFEQVVEGARVLAELLSSCSRLRALVTSRVLLRLRGERDFPVPPLPLPERQRSAGAAHLHRYASIDLFVQRAQQAKAGFALSSENEEAVAEICQRLDGLPLALELAAARVKVLSPGALLERLGSRLKVLTGGARDSPERQQTLRNTIAWSYDLLEEDERKLFRRLSVFVGGCTLEAAEAMCGTSDLEIDVLDGISSLLEKSLLRQEEPGESQPSPSRPHTHTPTPPHTHTPTHPSPHEAPRFTMLETIREYGQERLQECGEAEAARQGHVHFFLELAERAEPELSGRDQAAWLDILQGEHDNLRAAMDWATGSAPQEALRLAGALWRFWEVRGYFGEGRERLSAVLALSGERSGARARALNGAGNLAYNQGDYPAARSLHEESLAIQRELRDRQGMTSSLGNLGNLAWSQGDYMKARSLYQESLVIQRELGDRQGIANSLNGLGSVAKEQGDYTAARSMYEESLAIERQLGDRQGIAASLHNLGNMAWSQGDYTAARLQYEESLAVERELGNRQGIASSLHGLGSVAYNQADYALSRSLHEESLAIQRELGDRQGILYSLLNLASLAREQGGYTAARLLYEQSLEISRELGDRQGIAYSLLGLGSVASRQGDYAAACSLHEESLAIRRELGDRLGIADALEGFGRLAEVQQMSGRAARLLAAAEALREVIGTPLPPNERADYDRAAAATRAALGEIAFAAAWAEGRAMAMEEAIKYALEE